MSQEALTLEERLGLKAESGTTSPASVGREHEQDLKLLTKQNQIASGLKFNNIDFGNKNLGTLGGLGVPDDENTLEADLNKGQTALFSSETLKQAKNRLFRF